MNLRLCFAEQL